MTQGSPFKFWQTIDTLKIQCVEPPTHKERCSLYFSSIVLIFPFPFTYSTEQFTDFLIVNIKKQDQKLWQSILTEKNGDYEKIDLLPELKDKWQRPVETKNVEISRLDDVLTFKFTPK
eukprot:NODE_2_length_91304_cov_0.692462.p76 type:complete len:118 gc:universal NODE_2_length_91304_cov_0.692462:69329-68976(-)